MTKMMSIFQVVTYNEYSEMEPHLANGQRLDFWVLHIRIVGKINFYFMVL